MLLWALLISSVAVAQVSTDVLTRHKVKKSETIFGIAKKYGVTINDLIKANPEMNTPGYELKKGDFSVIPDINKAKNEPKPVATLARKSVKIASIQTDIVYIR